MKENIKAIEELKKKDEKIQKQESELTAAGQQLQEKEAVKKIF